MYTPPSLFQSSSSVDTYIERAQELKNENQIFPREIKYLIKKLEASVNLTHTTRKGLKIPGSRYSYSEIINKTTALRSLLLAVELIKRTRETPGATEALRARARHQLLKAIIAL